MSFGEQIMPQDKFLSIFSRRIEAIVFVIFQILFAVRVVLEIGGYRIFLSYSIT